MAETERSQKRDVIHRSTGVGGGPVLGSEHSLRGRKC
jgi:hypothetical protein